MRESRPGRPVDEAVSDPYAPSPPVSDELADLSAEHILEAIAEPCCILEIDGYESRVVWISAALSDATGYARGDVGPVGDLLTAEPIGGSDRLSGLQTMTRKDGSTYPASVTVRPLRMEGPGRPGWWLVSIRDASEELASMALLEERSATEERARRGLSLVARVSDILTDVASTEALGDIAALLTRRVVPWAAFYGYGNRLEQIVGLEGITQYGRQLPGPARREPAPGDVVGQLFRAPRMQRLVFDRGRNVPPDSLTAEFADIIAADPAAPDEGPLWLLPVLGGQGVLGFLAAQPTPPDSTDRRVLPPAELVTVLELVARRVGMAMDNLQLYAHEHQLAETLQRSMLPEQDVVDGVDVWSYYAASSKHAQVGGDWYDVLDLGQGRIGVVVGDVVGHDVEAAAAMGQLRSVTRAYAAEFIEPAAVLGKVDRLVAGMRMARPASFVYGLLMPTGEQQRQMRRFAGACRFVFNRALALQKARFEQGEKKLGYAGLCKTLTEWRHCPETAWLAEAPVHPLQQSLKDLERAYTHFFSKRAERPQFKKKGQCDSFRYPDPNQIKLDQSSGRIFLPKLGWLRYRVSREVLGAVKNVTVSSHCGKWYVSIQTERQVEPPSHGSSTAVGIDVGISRFATLSDGTFYAPLNSFKRHEHALRKAQQALSRKSKFSNNWRKEKARIQRIHARISNARRDYLHKTTTAISQNHAVVCIEDLQVRSMSRSAAGTAEAPGKGVKAKSGLNKSILDQGWFEFRRQMQYKLDWNGGWLVAVPARNTSRTCPACSMPP